MDVGTSKEPWLPDLCRLPRIAMVFAVAELVVAIIALAPSVDGIWSLQQFISASAFALWLSLTIAVMLCVSRQRLSALPQALGGALALCLAAVVAMLGAAMLYQLDTALDVSILPYLISLGEFVLGSAAIATLITAVVLRYLYVSESWQAQLRASSRAQVDALQARIRPHFLFNSMNTIASLVRHDPALAERAVLDLSDLFRAALGADKGSSTLAEEVELADRYLDIELLRLGDRLQVHWQKHEPLPWELSMPRLILQPLLENAVLHGISPLPQGGVIEIVLSMSEHRLHVNIRNPAPVASLQHRGAGHAQHNIEQRLRYAFGPDVRMTGDWHEGYYVCEVQLPVPVGMHPAGEAP